ncbi:hypothetical protein FRX31_021976 [Thalictrum thalictroides]|uniref:Uncharacterized protein n=1 Tax=Thalictrum thalictroides TaxID=46969 RepID=A0A7J6VUP9_THATH|nr:hypothetical protein FRX31_021976 [Thalictrum thalictroides]
MEAIDEFYKLYAPASQPQSQKPPDPHINSSSNPIFYKAVLQNIRVDSQWDIIYSIEQEERETFPHHNNFSSPSSNKQIHKVVIDESLCQEAEAP